MVEQMNNNNINEIKNLSEEIKQKQQILYDHSHNVKARHIKALLKKLEDEASTPPVESGKNPQEFDKLVDDLVTFVKTGKGPSDLLDAEMKKDKSLYVQLAVKIQKSAKLGIKHSAALSPLAYSMEYICTYPDVFKYLLDNGADYSHNQIDQITLGRVLLSNEDILLYTAEFLFKAGYFGIKSHITSEIYRRPSIKFRKKFDFMIWRRSPFEFARMNERVFLQACYEGDLKMTKYCHRQGINFRLMDRNTFVIDRNALLENVCGSGHLDILKYLLHHGEFNPSNIKKGLMSAVQNSLVQIVNYLYNYCEFKTIPIKQFFFKDELKPFNNSAATYYRYVNPDLRVGRPDFEGDLVTFQKDQLIQTNEILETAIKYFKKEGIPRAAVEGEQLMQLALTYPSISEEKAEIPTQISLLTAISHLPLIDDLAVEYAMYLVECSIEKNTTPIEILGLLAYFYNQYVKNTAHIKTSAREDLHYSLSWVTRYYSPDSLLAIQEASEVDLTLCPPKNTDEALLPKFLSRLVLEYIVFQTNRTPALIHMWRALKSNENCRHCGTVLLSDKQEITFLGNINKEAKCETSSPKINFGMHPNTLG